MSIFQEGYSIFDELAEKGKLVKFGFEDVKRSHPKCKDCKSYVINPRVEFGGVCLKTTFPHGPEKYCSEWEAKQPE